MKWLVFWKDGDVSLWDAREWTAAQIVALKMAIDAVLVEDGVSPVVAATWWASDRAHGEVAA
jgi:hypothetical protein